MNKKINNEKHLLNQFDNITDPEKALELAEKLNPVVSTYSKNEIIIKNL